MNGTRLFAFLLIFLLLGSLNDYLSAQIQELKFKDLSAIGKIPEAFTTCLFQDSKGFIWVGSLGGLARYDGYEYTHFFLDPDDSLSLGDNRINNISETNDQDLLVSTQSELFIFDRETETFTTFSALTSIQDTLLTDGIFEVISDQAGTLWIRTFRDLFAYNAQQSIFINFMTPPYWTPEWGNTTNVIEKTASEGIWVGTDKGLLKLSLEDTSIQSVNLNLPTQLAKNAPPVLSIASDKQQKIWLSTGTGLIQYNPIDKQSTYYKINEINFIRDLQIDLKGKIWYYSNKGIGVFDPVEDPINSQIPHLPALKGLASSYVLKMICDQEDNIWVGTINGIGVHTPLDRALNSRPTKAAENAVSIQSLRTFLELSPGNLLMWEKDSLIIYNFYEHRIQPFPWQPPIDKSPLFRISNFHKDRQGRIWMGTNRQGVLVYDPQSQQYQHFHAGKDSPFQLSSNIIRAILQDHTGLIWIATWHGGVTCIDEARDTTYYYFTNPSDLKIATRSILEDSKKNLWVGTRGGLHRFNRESNQFITYKHDSENPNSLTENTPFSVYENENGIFWIGTYGGGLNVFDPVRNTFRHYSNQDGLPNNNIWSVYPDGNGNIWLGTALGLVKFNPLNASFRVYDRRDGFINNSYPTFSHYQSPFSGHLFYEGFNGIDYFHPDSIPIDQNPPRVVLTDFQLFNQSVPIKNTNAASSGKHSYLLDESIYTIDKIVLPFNQNVITFKFAAINFRVPEKNKYAYQLEGFDQEWQHIGTRRTATFTNLKPGSYTFRVKACNADGVWNEQGTSVELIILPPWWQSWWAWSLYVILFGLIFWWILYVQRRRERLKAQLALEQQEAEKLKELDLAKTRIYTNITHEFRTPLTVIAGMADQIRKAPAQWLEKGTDIIRRNTSQMLQLVNQLLDLRKLEVGSLEYHPVHSDVLAFLKYLSESFDSMARSKGVELHFLNEVPEIHMDFDPGKIQRIFSNLLSNAVKFTPSGGHVYVQTNRIHLEEQAWFQLKIRDTGTGIAPEELPRIFDRFYQVDDSSTRQAEGTGIGLALTQELVRFLHGTIEVQSQLAKGTSFVVQLPIKEEAEVTTLPFDEKTATILPLADAPIVQPPESTPTNALPTLLVIEDNADVVTYIQATLESGYHIEVAFNGAQGIEQAIANVPDLIISDVMMPEKDGFEVCATLKKDRRTSHIPIILLTAKADDTSRLQGLEHGADAYLSKPFRQDELKIRLRKLLELRQALQQKYAQLAPIEPDQKEELSSEERFLFEARSVVEQHLDDPEFGPTQLQRALGVSRTQLFNKLKALTGRSASSFIRGIRLQHGRRLLQTTDKTVAEVTYAVGFGDPNYFSRCYREEFGVRPSEERSKL